MTLHEGLLTIGQGVFGECDIRNLTIPASVTSVGYLAFHDNTNMESLTFLGKTLEQVQAMDNYPWGITDTSIIHAG